MPTSLTQTVLFNNIPSAAGYEHTYPEVYMAIEREGYAARLEVDYPEQLDRVTTFFRLIWTIPIGIIFALLAATGDIETLTTTGERVSADAGGILAGLAGATGVVLILDITGQAALVTPRGQPF